MKSKNKRWIKEYYIIFIDFLRPFHVEPKNIIDDSAQEKISAEAAVLNSRLHYYSRLTGSSDRLLVGRVV